MSEDELIGDSSMTKHEAMLEGYPGAALLVNDSGEVTATNSKGQSFASLLRAHDIPALTETLNQARADNTISLCSLTMESDQGGVFLEAVVCNRLIDAGHVLVYHASSTQAHVTHLGIAHLPGR